MEKQKLECNSSQYLQVFVLLRAQMIEKVIIIRRGVRSRGAPLNELGKQVGEICIFYVALGRSRDYVALFADLCKSV